MLALALLLVVLPGAAWAGRGHGGGGHGHGGHGGHGHGGHHGGSKFVFGFGPWWGWPGYGWYGPRYYYPYAYPVYPAPVYAPPRVVIEEPPVYIERDAAPAAPGWWYYCESAGAYYPDVPSCAEPWVKVPPRGE